MNCPYCNAIMEEGYIKTGLSDEIFWFPKAYNPFGPISKRKVLEEGGFWIESEGHPDRLVNNIVKMNLCRNCLKMVIDLPEKIAPRVRKQLTHDEYGYELKYKR